MTGFGGLSTGYGGGLAGGSVFPCPSCGCDMIRMSSGATCPECGAFVGGGGAKAPPEASKTYRSITPTKSTGIYAEWPTEIAKGSRIGFEKDGVIWVGIVKDYEVDEETGEVRMTIE